MNDPHHNPRRDPRLVLLASVLALLAGTGAVLIAALLAHQVL
jgi:hypothetical protein